MYYRPKATTTPSNSTFSQGEASTSAGPPKQVGASKATTTKSTPSQREASTRVGPSKQVGASKASNNSNSNVNSQPTRNVTSSNSHPTPKGFVYLSSAGLVIMDLVVLTARQPWQGVVCAIASGSYLIGVVSSFIGSGFGESFCDTFPGSVAIFQPYRISDHSPCVLRIPNVAKLKPKPFKFSNFLVHKEGFLDTVISGWNINVNGCAMYRVVKRLKGLKSPFRKLLHSQGNLHERVDRLRKELDEVQKAIDKDPFNSALRSAG
ncbi:RNA-directed DNA polymerase, eukaryota, Reverse transcriptase zinc-binding domain protein [Artemisia annua]|uniref:RNA-directed DNA polymerase, eukaryota, Reverse transcriptase zinc-binding domain protein n=1 Tax=Artemisia annua TaxID=35608 RepID=A0A2U1LQ13_ARTAN|nr:RNA-directed DNA polymerase, eukaryota, Reverse transcriptase zinc-binding domain protein [Artemisia annua]